MDLATCLKKMQLVGVLAFATVDADGAPQIRNISAIHYEEDAIYFFTARGKNFCRELQQDGRVQILCYTRYKEMIRMSGKAYAVAESEQEK
ncbi:pyridoxamine 5'-phosphate oxidase family protein [Roseburia amylophila]|uniref:pyridoxamine 5'-phosphate oxidase family protein n=1 Tax=Roseburia amylophila TaxID=2981794 RepID=UPI0032BF2692